MTDRTTLDAEDWISPAAAAALLGVTPKTVSRLADAGEIRAIRPGAHRRYLRSDVEAKAATA
jgi:excisionase family DNA binding protein